MLGNLKDFVALTELALDFGTVKRATCHQDGVTHETDTTHTVMLLLCVMRALMEHREYVRAGQAQPLDEMLVMVFAVAHDLAEAPVFKGGFDVSTRGRLSPQAQAEKNRKEEIGRARIRARLPWLADILDRYEAQDTLEAQFVKVMDKVMPDLTNLCNGFAPLIRDGWTLDKLTAVKDEKHRHLAGRVDAEAIPFPLELQRQVNNAAVFYWGKETT